MSLKQLFATLNVAGTLAAPKTAAYSATPEDTVIICDGVFTVTLPTRGIAEPGNFWLIYAKDTDVVTVATEGDEEINGSGTAVTSANEALLVISDGTDCFALQIPIPS